MVEEQEQQKIKIFVDNREMNSGVIRALEKYPDCEIILKNLEVGDYIVSDRVGVERKTAEDFLESMIGQEKGKLLRQCYDLAHSYQRPLLLMECNGVEDLFIRNIYPAAVWAFIRSIIWSGCAVEFSGDSVGTARMLYERARKEQLGNPAEFSPHSQKSKRSPNEAKIYTLSSIPGIGTKTAKDLLEAFGSIQAVINASENDLMEIDGIGAKTAIAIRQLVTGEYK